MNTGTSEFPQDDEPQHRPFREQPPITFGMAEGYDVIREDDPRRDNLDTTGFEGDPNRNHTHDRPLEDYLDEAPTRTAEATDGTADRPVEGATQRPGDLAGELRDALVAEAAGRLTRPMLNRLTAGWTPANSSTLAKAADTLAALQNDIAEGVITETGALNTVEAPLRPFLHKLLGISLDAAFDVFVPPLGMAIRFMRATDVAGALLSGEAAGGRGLQQVAECASAKKLAHDLTGHALADMLNQALEQHSPDHEPVDPLEVQRRAADDAFDALWADIERRRRERADQALRHTAELAHMAATETPPPRVPVGPIVIGGGDEDDEDEDEDEPGERRRS